MKSLMIKLLVSFGFACVFSQMSFADSGRCSAAFRKNLGPNTLYRETQLPLTEKDWVGLESFLNDKKLDWFENKQTLSDLTSAYIPTARIETVAKKLVKFLKETEGIDSKIRFEIEDGSQVNIMRSGSFIGRHYDGPLSDGKPSPFVFLLGLSGDYVGGKFVTYKGETGVVANKSTLQERTMLILRQEEYHSVEKVISGERASIVIRVTPK